MAMLLVLAAVAMASILSFSYLVRQSTITGLSRNFDSHNRARFIAESGLAIALAHIRTTDDWRDGLSEGVWLSEQSYGGGTFTVSIVDGIEGNGDGNLADDATDPVTLSVVGRYGDVTHTVRGAVTPSAATTDTLLFVVPNAQNLGEQEQAKKAILEDWGYKVRPLAESATQVTFDSAVAEVDVVYVSENVSASRVSDKLRGAPVGVVNAEKNLADDLGFSSGTGAYTGQTVYIEDNTHYITAPFAVGELVIAGADSRLHTARKSVSGDARILARRSADSDPALLILDAGDAMVNGGVAPARRVHLPWGDRDFDIHDLTANGLALWRRALEWAAQPVQPVSPVARWALNDISGTTAVDSISHIDGRLENGAALMDPGVLGTAVRFDGSNDHILVPHNDALALDEGTVSFWFKADRLSGWQGLVSKDSLVGRNDSCLTIYTEYSRLKVRCRSHWNSRGISTDSVLVTGQWYHAAVTVSENKVRLYLDGQLVDEGGYNGGLTGATPMAFGAATWWSYGNYTTLTDFFQGAMDDVRIYDYGLSSAEITALYEEGDQEDEQAPQLIADYTFEEVIYEPTLVMHFPLDETGVIVAQAAAVSSNNGNHYGQLRNGNQGNGQSNNGRSNDGGGGQQQITQTVVDAVGGLTGECENGVDLNAAGHSATAAQFDGSNDYIVIPHHQAMLLDEGAVSFWFNSQDQWQSAGLFSKDSTNYDTGGHLHICLEDRRVNVRLQSSRQSYELRSRHIAHEQWHHVTVTFGPNGMKLYVNGELEDSEDYTGGLGPSSGGAGNREPIVLGADATHSGDQTHWPLRDYFEGMIDEVRLYDRALDAQQVTDLFGDRALSPSTGPGSTVVDVSGYEQPLNLAIQDTTGIAWLEDGGLQLDRDTRIVSSAAATKIAAAVAATDEVTLSVLFQPRRNSQSNNARIVSYSKDNWDINMGLAHDDRNYLSRVRTTQTSAAAAPSIESPDNSLSNSILQHVVVTYDAKHVKMWRNGVLEVSEVRTGDLDNWDRTMRLAMGNEVEDDHPWQGTLYRVSIYDRALNAFQVEDVFRGERPGTYTTSEDISYTIRWLEIE